ncbi:MAG: hypothetical protein LBF62_05940 [Tannerellaceae bacterium]|nr:hypothetical protein [Tannerellaceae bacterium]
MKLFLTIISYIIGRCKCTQFFLTMQYGNEAKRRPPPSSPVQRMFTQILLGFPPGDALRKARALPQKGGLGASPARGGRGPGFTLQVLLLPPVVVRAFRCNPLRGLLRAAPRPLVFVRIA